MEIRYDRQGMSVSQKDREKIDEMMKHGFSEWGKFVVQTKVKDFMVPIANVTSVTTNDTIRVALMTLAEYKIQSVPVYDTEKKTFIGFVDGFDTVTYLVQNCSEKLLTDPTVSMLKLTEMDAPVDRAINVSKHDSLHAVNSNEPLLTLLELMGHGDLRRVFVLHPDTRAVIGLVTQSKVIQLLFDEMAGFQQIARKTMQEMGLSAKVPVYKMKETDLALDAFKLMIEKEVSGLAVVNENDELIDAITTSDIRGSIGIDILSDLRKPIREYLHKLHLLTGKPPAPFYCATTDSLCDVLRILDIKRIHRLFVVDEKKRPIHVISLRDILCVLLDYVREYA
jgi:CBS domain-containing protein